VTGWGLKTGGDLRAVSIALRHAGDGREIRKQFSRELRNAAAPLVPAVRRSVMAIPVKGVPKSASYPEGPGLRARIARATRLQLRLTGRIAGVRIFVDPRRMPMGQKALQNELEGLKRWRHPVFGDSGVWVQQEPHPYFFPALRTLGPKATIATQLMIRKITQEITLGKGRQV
jgi:hypothetical protein